MTSKLLSLWQKASKTLDAVIISVLVVLLVLLALIILGYIFNWPWTGLHGRTLYDWLQLLIIPAVLAIGGYLFNFANSRTERDLTTDNQRETTLKEYIDQLSELLLEKKLRDSQPDDEVRKIARVRTLIVLQRLDAERKGNVLNFLYESGLIEKDKRIIDLRGADLRKAELSFASLNDVNLNGTDLRGANLEGASLFEADLEGADLKGANLESANLYGADLRGAKLESANLRDAQFEQEEWVTTKSLKNAIMPDGSIHP